MGNLSFLSRVYVFAQQKVIKIGGMFITGSRQLALVGSSQLTKKCFRC